MAIDTTPGSATAVAYDDAAAADAYFLARNITTWTGTDAVKEAALIRGTDYLERRYIGQWIGVKATEAQSLAWPRIDAVDVDGYSYDSDEIPTALKHANFEAALLVLTGTDLEPVLERGGSITKERVKAGPVESETEYSSGAAARSTFTAIDGLVSGLISGGGSTVELLRV
jgi:hypothetical protein